MYQGYLKSFYQKYPDVRGLSYDEHYNLLLKDSTEFVASYSRTFVKLGIEAKCVIINDINLQNMWRMENEIKAISSREILFQQINKCKPEILWIDDLNLIDRDWIEKIRKSIQSIRLILAYHCSGFNSLIINKLKGVDLIITCTPGLKSEFEKYGLRSYLVYHGFDYDLLERIKETNVFPENDLVFSGSLFLGVNSQNSRLKLIEDILKNNIEIALYLNLEKKYKILAKQSIYYMNSFLKMLSFKKLVKYFPYLEDADTLVKPYSETLLAKARQPVFGIDMYKLLAKAGISLNMHGDGAGEYAGNMRLFEATGAGSCLLTDNKKNMSHLFELNSEVVVYDSAQDCIQKIIWLLENKEEMKKIASSGNKRTLKSHLVIGRCEQILEIIKNELK